MAPATEDGLFNFSCALYIILYFAIAMRCPGSSRLGVEEEEAEQMFQKIQSVSNCTGDVPMHVFVLGFEAYFMHGSNLTEIQTQGL